MTADQIREFKRKLYEGPVEFSYYKILKDSRGKYVKDDNGVPVFDEDHLQTTRGTKNIQILIRLGVIQEEVQPALQAKPEGEQRKAVETAVEATQKAKKVTDSIGFYDLVKNGWRTVKEGGLVDFR